MPPTALPMKINRKTLFIAKTSSLSEERHSFLIYHTMVLITSVCHKESKTKQYFTLENQSFQTKQTNKESNKMKQNKTKANKKHSLTPKTP